MKHTEIEPWMYEVYLKMNNNPNLLLGHSFELARLFCVDFERALLKMPSWYVLYLKYKADGYSDRYVASMMLMSTETMKRKIEDFRCGRRICFNKLSAKPVLNTL